MPSLARLAGTLDEEHGLHALDVGANQLCQDFDNPGLADCVQHDVGNFVGKVDANCAGDDVLIALGRIKIGQTLHQPALAAADLGRLVA